MEESISPLLWRDSSDSTNAVKGSKNGLLSSVHNRVRTVDSFSSNLDVLMPSSARKNHKRMVHRSSSQRSKSASTVRLSISAAREHMKAIRHRRKSDVTRLSHRNHRSIPPLPSVRNSISSIISASSGASSRRESRDWAFTSPLTDEELKLASERMMAQVYNGNKFGKNFCSIYAPDDRPAFLDPKGGTDLYLKKKMERERVRRTWRYRLGSIVAPMLHCAMASSFMGVVGVRRS